MPHNQILSVKLRLGAAAGTLALLAACGGGGGGGNVISTPSPQPAPSPVPTPAPTPSPTPTPTPPPGTSFNTEEFRQSAGPSQHGATAAWQRGATGSGETIAIVDTGIDTDSPEFAGRIHPDSRDVAATRGFEAEDDHGTNVALVAAAARNNSGILGIAYDSRLLVLRADRVGSCGADTPENTNLTCSFFDSDIAKGIDQAVTSGATVINLSLGGGNPSAAVMSAARRASAAGVVIVIAAGNAGDGSTTGVNPAEPTNFARGIREAGGDNVIIVGSINESFQLSSFSQRAGSQANFFLTARGERICCVYENGQVFVGRDPQGTFRLLFSGTSFAAPQVAGAVALLAQAFPNLTGAQIVQILLETARDLGDAGVDATYGRGSLDITAAFAPRGTTTLAGSTSVVRLGETGAVGSAAMGDAFAAPQDARGIVLDGYQRAYEYDFTATARGAAPEYRLHRALEPGTRQIGGGSEALSLAFTVGEGQLDADAGMPRQLQLSRGEAEDARVLAARMIARVAPDLQVGFALREGSSGLRAQVQSMAREPGNARPAFLIARDAAGDTGFAHGSDASVAVRREVGSFGITASAESGEVWLGNWRQARDILPGKRERRALRSFGLAADRSFGDMDMGLGLTWLQEDDTMLGAFLHDSLGASGADTLFLDTSGSLDLAGGWSLGAAYRHGFTKAAGGGSIADGSRFQSNAWSLDVSRAGVLTYGDSFGFRLAQPLRVTRGGIDLHLPVGYDYASASPEFGTRHLSFAPQGREIVGELGWRGPLAQGQATASIYYRTEPGHYATARDDAGVAVTWRKGF